MARKVDPEEQRQVLDAQMAAAMTEHKREEFNETRSLLDQLRRTRAARGGVGAPLQVPLHLRDAAAGMGIVVTDADLDPDAKPRTREEQDDLDSDRAHDINRERER